ncbi:hypothetical protein AIOL_000346 [Candidatus Rhodobacter oscarellae]|uniref:Cyclopropane-fatty-acyl-phospholipid synthase n=1 Tax=Candidatus Rhodobacter oscarellae TaxID=1675527 RepID=A0A0J9H3H0_9RHOB|nr:DUF1365 domain-containing protein [Candidatus Rhodobacter lobularis]KMW60193.1 hypothetical protein AIOL_000346 [Candidatus Rhodobacter lobularis]
MSNRVDHIRGETHHARHGAVENAFRYRVDYLCLDLEAGAGMRPAILRRNRRGLLSLWDSDHGGAPGKGRGAAWVRQVLGDHGLHLHGRILLVAQPRVLGHVFNPVSFWLCHDEAGALRVVIAEVSNTYGDRHSYFCHRDDLAPITAADTLTARKIFHVSPFQPVEGEYSFRFDIREDRLGIWIDFRSGNGGVYATLTGKRAPATTWGLIAACLRRPFGSRRVLGLIHWQALKLWWKGAAFRNRPEPPAQEITR